MDDDPPAPGERIQQLRQGLQPARILTVAADEVDRVEEVDQSIITVAGESYADRRWRRSIRPKEWRSPRRVPRPNGGGRILSRLHQLAWNRFHNKVARPFDMPTGALEYDREAVAAFTVVKRLGLFGWVAGA
jgi:hypothetical protein